MKPKDLNDLEKIISEEASESEIKKFDDMFRELPLEKPGMEFTDKVVSETQLARYRTKIPVKHSLLAVGIVVAISLIFVALYDNFAIPTMTDPLLQQWVPPVGESTGMIKQIILIVDSILMLVLMDKFILGPLFQKRSFSS